MSRWSEFTFWGAFRAKWRNATPSAAEFGAFFGGVTWLICALGVVAGVAFGVPLLVVGVLDLMGWR